MLKYPRSMLKASLNSRILHRSAVYARSNLDSGSFRLLNTLSPVKSQVVVYDGTRPLSIEILDVTAHRADVAGGKPKTSRYYYPMVDRSLPSMVAFQSKFLRCYSTAPPSNPDAFPKNLKFVVGYAGLPHPKKGKGLVQSSLGFPVFGCGEDAFFIRQDALAVADGVGGWAQSGGNPGLYSLTLLENLYASFEGMDNVCSEDFVKYDTVNPIELIDNACQKTQEIIGSCTLCTAIVRNGELRVDNIGDSGALVYRQGSCILRTKEQQHGFNYPYQLGPYSKDRPTDAQIYKQKLEAGDIVVLATDGLFDNLYDHQIMEIIQKYAGTHSLPTQIDLPRMCEELVQAALKVARDSRAFSPFAQKSKGIGFSGGKLDDISIVAGLVDFSGDSPDRR